MAMSARARRALPKSDFALPASAAKSPVKGAKGSYPIPNAAHARNALARVSQHGTPAQQATVKAKVKAKFPSIKVGGAKPKADGHSHDAIMRMSSGPHRSR